MSKYEMIYECPICGAGMLEELNRNKTGEELSQILQYELLCTNPHCLHDMWYRDYTLYQNEIIESYIKKENNNE